MPTPMYRFRLAKDTKESLEEMSKTYGAPNPSAFIREIITVICSHDIERLQAFFGRLQEKITGQLPLSFQEQAAIDMKAATDAVAEAGKRLKEAKQAVKRSKEAKRGQRPT